MPYPATLIAFAPGTILRSADANSNNDVLRNSLLTAVLKDTAATITVGHTINPTAGDVLTATPFVGGKGIVINAAIQVTSQPLLDFAQTWNAAGVTFTGLKFNVTDTASAAASLLIDLQVATVSKFKVDKAGAMTIAGGLTIAGALAGVTTIAGTLSTAAQPNVTSVGTLTSLTTAGDISITSLGNRVNISGNQIIGVRKTGWATATGTATRTTFDTASVTLPQLAERMKALLDDLHATAGHGLIGT